MGKANAEVLFCNERFYAAFADGDFPAMAALWGEEGSLCCLHPGWEPLHDRTQILASWQAILQTPPDIRCADPNVLSLGPQGAAVICWEVIGGDPIIATNLFRQEAGGWRIVHHQAGPARGGPTGTDTLPRPDPTRLN